MHNTDASGNEHFACDFCHQPWSDSRPMVEGHQGSLICSNCLSIAYSETVHLNQGSPTTQDEKCLLCLENNRQGPHWRSPMFNESIACIRCLKQSAGVLQKDPDFQWQKPRSPSKE